MIKVITEVDMITNYVAAVLIRLHAMTTNIIRQTYKVKW